MRFLSLFSGIEAASLAWLPLGWTCAAVAEIEPFPCAVLKHYYPETPNLGDITKITKQQIESLGKIDVVVGGFPCQDLSIAGKRKGLKNAGGTNTRSGLFHIAMQVIEWANPRFTVIENVPGLFSSNSGRDFASVVGELAGCKFSVPREGWRTTGVALGPIGLVEWTVLDAQYFGVAQRRNRVFLVRDSGNWKDRPPILFERESLSGNHPPSRETRQDAAGCAAAGVGVSGEVAQTINSQIGGGDRVKEHSPSIANPLGSHKHGGGKTGSGQRNLCADVATVDAQNKTDRGDSQHCDRLIIEK